MIKIPLAGIFATLLCLVFAAAALYVYRPILSGDSLQDDPAVALANPAVVGGGSWWAAPFYADLYRAIWRPMTTLTLRWNWIASGASRDGNDRAQVEKARLGMVRVNLLLLIMGAALGVLLLIRLKVNHWVSITAGAVLLLHPVNVESVLRLAGRAELLSNVLSMTALLVYLMIKERAAESSPPLSLGRAGRCRVYLSWVCFVMLFLLALGARESALLLPALIIGYEAVGHLEGSRSSVRRVAVMLALCAAGAVLWGAVRHGVLQGVPAALRLNPAADYLRALDSAERVRLALSLPLLYARALLLAGPILPDYSHLLARPETAPPVVLGEPRTFGVNVPDAGAVTLGVAVLAATFVLFALLRARRPRAAWGAWMLGVTLLVALPLLRTNGHVASPRHLFLPLLGLLIIVTDVGELLRARFEMLPKRRAPRWVAVAAIALLLTLCASLCGLSARVTGRSWSSQDALIKALGRAAPLSVEVPLYYASSALSGGDYEHAAQYLEEAIGLFPRNPRALLNLGLIRAQKGQVSLAGRIFHDAVAVSRRVLPGSAVEAKAHLSLGTLLARQGDENAALAEFRTAIAIDSTNVDALASAGVIEAMSYPTARDGIRHITRALELDRERGALGALGERMRSLRERAEVNAGIIDKRRAERHESGDQQYRDSMGAAESSATGGTVTQEPHE